MKSFKWLLLIGLIFILPVYAEETIDLTEEERAFIEDHPLISMGVDPTFVPFEFLDTDGTYKGIANDYIELLSQKTGLKFVIKEGLTWSQAYEQAVEGEIDILPCIANTGNRASYFLFSDKYYDYQRVMILKKGSSIKKIGDLEGKTVAIQKNSSHQGYIEAYDQIEADYYDRPEDALKAVADGVNEVFIGNLATASYYINKYGYSDLTYINLKTDNPTTLHFAVRKDWPELVSIINKGIGSITESEKIKIHNEWIGLKENTDYTWLIRILIIIGMVTAVTLAVSSYWISKLKKEIKRRKETEAALIIAKQEAENANEVKSNFLARMSHEIRTPLNAITGLSYLLNQTSLDGTQKSHVEKIRHAGSIMLSIINDILDFSKIEAGKVTIEHAAFNLDDVIRDVLNIISFKIEEKDLHFTFTKDPRLPNNFFGDSKRLEQVLLNIMNNAVKFTSEGEIELAIELIGFQKNLYEVEFRIKDTGIGMSDDHLEKLFEPFSQEDASISRRFGGTGLGLSIVKNLTDLMGGHIEVESTLGQGTTFKINIKLDKDQDKESELRSTYDYISGIKTLMINKDIKELHLVMGYFRSIGIDPEFTSSRHQLEQMFMTGLKKGNKPYDLIVIDEPDDALLDMVLKQDFKVKIIACSERGLEMENKRVQVIKKPIFPSLLYNMVVDMFHYKVMASHESHDTSYMPDRVEGSVLIVDDNKTNQLIARSLLESADLDIDVADNGKEAVDLVKTNDYDLVLMDLHMPVMDGYEASKIIRTFNEGVTIIAMTADAIEGVKERCHAYGMSHFISKPFDPQQFVADIFAILKGKDQVADKTYDKDKGLKFMGGNTDLYRQVILAFLDENQETIPSLEKAIGDKAYQEAIDIAHKVKGSSGSIGSDSVHQLALELQQALEDESHDDIIILKDHFVEHLQALLSDLTEEYTQASS